MANQANYSGGHFDRLYRCRESSIGTTIGEGKLGKNPVPPPMAVLVDQSPSKHP